MLQYISNCGNELKILNNRIEVKDFDQSRGNRHSKRAFGRSSLTSNYVNEAFKYSQYLLRLMYNIP